MADNPGSIYDISKHKHRWYGWVKRFQRMIWKNPEMISQRERGQNVAEMEAGERLLKKYDEKKRLRAEQQAEQKRLQQLEEEKIQRIARQEEIRLNEMRARERRLAEERAQQKRGRR